MIMIFVPCSLFTEPMKEDFLHFLWKQKLLPFNCLQTVTGKQKIQISDFGIYNTDSGPDFSNVKVLVEDITWFGNVEMHLKSSDWYVHHHEIDTRYDNVILHVVWEYDVEIFDKNNMAIPTLELKNYINPSLVDNYNSLFSSKQKWIPCEGIADFSKSMFLTNWLERLYFERLERKGTRMMKILTKTKNDWEYVLFVFLSEAFGLHLNKDPFFDLAMSIPFHTFRKVRNYEDQLFALLFGQAGFLTDSIEDSYFLTLQSEYQFIQKKYLLKPLHKGRFQFFRTRPSNFPTIRLAQLATLLFHRKDLFADLMNSKTKKDIYSIFKIPISDYWKLHYDFDKTSKKSLKVLTTSFIDLLIINTILPIKFLYLRSKGEDKNEDLLSIILNLKPERNSIIEKFKKVKLEAENALDSQALLELKNMYCTKKRCLHCAVGVRLMKHSN